MSRRSRIGDLIAEQLAAANSAAPAPVEAPQRVAAGPVRTMGLTLDKLELERKSLEAAIADGARVVELDPAAVDDSFAADRFAAEDDSALAELKMSIAASGQEVPILVRPHPDAPGRYQAAYGHRRLRACRELGLRVKALVKPLSDDELVVAQGLENAARVDLSFIEKALFALNLEEEGFERTTIMAALATDKTELSKLIAAARAVPEDIARAIGPAPKAGRRRWLQLGDALAKPDVLARVRSFLRDPNVHTGSSDSDSRFALVLAVATESAAVKLEAAPHRRTIKGAGGEVIARVIETDGRLEIGVDRAKRRAFADFLVRRLAGLHDEFLAEEAQPRPRRG
jgi:ParB family transcriptional regulator, chromosome partitioning protein